MSMPQVWSMPPVSDTNWWSPVTAVGVRRSSVTRRPAGRRSSPPSTRRPRLRPGRRHGHGPSPSAVNRTGPVTARGACCRGVGDRAVAQLAEGVVAPAPRCAVRVQATGAGAAGRQAFEHQRRVGGRPDRLGLLGSGVVAELTRRVGAPAPGLACLRAPADVHLPRHELHEGDIAQHLHRLQAVLVVAAGAAGPVAELPERVVAPAPGGAIGADAAREVATGAQRRELQVAGDGHGGRESSPLPSPSCPMRL